MAKNCLFICERCQPRLEKKEIKVTTNISREIVKEMKNKFVEQHGHKPTFKTCLTTCQGSCSPQGISYMELTDNKISDEGTLELHLSYEDLASKIIK